jgi:hypothetical protein
MKAIFKDANGREIAHEYQRVVIGGQGPYIEFDKDDFSCDIITKPGQEYRGKGKYKYVKYFHLMPTDCPEIKIYHQQRGVDYADYKIGMYYISPNDLVFEGELYAEIGSSPGTRIATTYHETK